MWIQVDDLFDHIHYGNSEQFDSIYLFHLPLEFACIVEVIDLKQNHHVELKLLEHIIHVLPIIKRIIKYYVLPVMILLIQEFRFLWIHNHAYDFVLNNRKKIERVIHLNIQDDVKLNDDILIGFHLLVVSHGTI